MQTPEETPSRGMRIRPAQESDVSRVLSIYRHYVRSTLVTFDEQPPTLRHYRRKAMHLVEAGFPFLVIEDESGIVQGFARVQPFRPKSAFRHTVELSIYLAPDQTGRGHGAALLDRLLQDCQSAGFREMVAVISDANPEASLALHQRRGFVEVGRMPHVGRKFNQLIGIIILQKSLHHDA